MSVYVLGLSAYYHDSAACLLRDGEIVAAAQEERFTRKRHDAAFPARAVEWCLAEEGIDASRVDHVCFYDKPVRKFARLLETHLAIAPRGARPFLLAMPVWLREKLWTAREIEDALGSYQGDVLFTEHHQAHAASAFYPSPFDSAAVLTLDGVGEWATASAGVGRRETLELHREIHYPHSIGLLYSAFTYHAGFRVNSGEYKLMGLAPYGKPRFRDVILRELIDLKDDGSFRLNLDYFDYLAGLKMTNARFDALFEGPPRKSEGKLTEREMDMAASVQVVTEEVVLRICRDLHEKTGEKNLCLAGGVALNCVANGKIVSGKTGFDRIWVQPAAGDAGGALGAALSTWHVHLAHPRSPREGRDAMRGALLGPRFDAAEIDRVLAELEARAAVLERDALYDRVAELLADGAIIGWFQGRMEFGPRALGARSILGDPRDATMQRRMNLKIKFRESFRPFAPAVLAEHAGEYFDASGDSPYMLVTAQVKDEHRIALSPEDAKKTGIDLLNVKRSTLPAITHVDGSARLQTVTRDANAPFHDLLSAFRRRTGCPVLVNTSFNVRGEPIVCTPREAYTCFMRTDIDWLVLEDRLLDKREQPEWREEGWRDRIAPD
ncbi:MAG TPA: carbamoyltransferase [Polyangiaceae bacterium]